jgi:pyruvate dehydrogenase E1 component alpha subunit
MRRIACREADGTTGPCPVEEDGRMIENYDPLKNQMLQILDPEGRVKEGIRPDLADGGVYDLYRKMVLIRIADEKALALQRQGRLGTYAPLIGQEAAQAGSAHALGKGDWVFPSFRETGVLFLRGVPLRNIYLYWMGNEMGQKVSEEVNVFPISVPVGTHLLHAVGAGWAAKIQKEKICTIVYFGDGATSEGDFHEAMNFAGVFQTPTVFFCQNNQYAISVARKRQTASPTLAQKAIAYGFPGIQVDGNDLFAVYAATREARERALSGLGPTFIEAVTYRFGPHTTADDPTKYRQETEVEDWKPRDPLLRLQKYLQAKGLWDEAREKEIQAESEKVVNQEIQEAEAIPPPAVEDIFQYTFAAPTHDLKAQMEDYANFLQEKEQPSAEAKHG